MTMGRPRTPRPVVKGIQHNLSSYFKYHCGCDVCFDAYTVWRLRREDERAHNWANSIRLGIFSINDVPDDLKDRVIAYR